MGIGIQRCFDFFMPQPLRMQTNIREVTEQFEREDVCLTSEGLKDMRNDCLDMLKAIIWMLDGAKYLWQD